MFPFTPIELKLLITAVVFIFGCMCFLIGIFILISRGYSREIRSLASHTATIGQKGIANEVTGLVSSASELVIAINQLVRTSSGIGAFLMLIGMAMVGASFWSVQQIEMILG